MITNDILASGAGGSKGTSSNGLSEMLGFDDVELQQFLDTHAGASTSEEAQGSPISIVVTASVHC